MNKIELMLHLEEKTLREILNKVEKNPEETCGFLLGKSNKNDKTIATFIAAKNVSKNNKAQRYEISPKAYLMAEKAALENKMEILGIYHTHLNWPANPSETDRLAAFPGLSYMIISLREQVFSDIKSWLLTEDFSFKEEKIELKII
ncbi:Mov34/MPN/PAD-1 family protein [Cyclobacterium qasimii]|uniref:Mov34/MPN/PAD-1 family protein n=1 Tax=Cyclobacterium qasimii TaxID=1350429 RepID=UPI0013785672|nr:M67 family metallopeptidase [Cyclobacterium qasimii]